MTWAGPQTIIYNMSTWDPEAWDEVGVALPLPSIGPSAEPARVVERHDRRAALRDVLEQSEVEAYPGQAMEVEAARRETDEALGNQS